MKRIWTWIRNEPAMVASLVIAGLNALGMTVTEGGVDALELIVESAAVIASGGIVRQSVTPVAKLKAQAAAAQQGGNR